MLNEIVAVTGSNGFIGRQVCAMLVREGLGVRAVIRDKANATILPSNVTPIITGDLRFITDWKPFLDGVDVVIHLAARVHQMKEDQRNSEDIYQPMNVGVTQALATAAGQTGVRRFILLSSVKAMGESTPPGASWNEDFPCLPQDAYGRSKRDAEKVLIDISRRTGLSVVILRLPLVYGPGVKANMARLFRAVQNGIPLPFARVHNARSLLYVENLVDAVRVSLDHPSATGEVFLVSDGEDVSTPELIRRLARTLSRPARLIPIPPSLMRWAGALIGRSEEVDRLLGSLVVDSRNIRRLLNWKPPYTLDQGLKETADWYRTVGARHAVPLPHRSGPENDG